jgi:hypothetical protein
MSSRRSKTFSKNRPNRERGIALISVLWVLLLLSGLAGAAAFMARTNAILTHKLGEYAQAESTADAAIVKAVSELSDEKSSRHPPVDGQPQTWDLQGIPVTVSISNEAGRIDVNTADDDLILAFLQSQGLSEETASRLLSDLNGLRQASNRTNNMLRTLEELRQIPSWKAQNIDCWADSLTVYTGLPAVGESDAPEPIKEALVWARNHHTNGQSATATTAAAPNFPAGRSVLGEVLRIVAKVSLPTNIRASSEWVGRLTGDVHQPMLTLRWSRAETVLSTACEKR